VNGNSVFIRSVDDPLVCDVYTEHSQAVSCAKYAPSGFYIASADQTGKVRIWDTTNKEHLLKNEFQPISGCIKDLQWSGDSQRIVVGGEGREKFGHVFSADTGTSVGEIMGTSKPLNSVDFRAQRPFRCVVGSEDNSICYFEGPPFKWKRTLSEHERFVNVVRYSPDGERFASGAADGRLIVFDGKTGDKLYEVNNASGGPAHAGSIYSLCWDPSSKLILTVSGDKSAKLWNVEQRAQIK
jgi:WD40 repeat protein